jgi:hypothetical protein
MLGENGGGVGQSYTENAVDNIEKLAQHLRAKGYRPRTTAPKGNVAEVLTRVHTEFTREELEEFDRLVREERRRDLEKVSPNQ